jgi:Glycosyltransferase like family 2
VIAGPRRGAAAALNAGIRAARHPIIAQVDQDVIIGADWMAQLAAALDDPELGAAQGYYVADSRSTVWARVMGLDLEQRYGRMTERFIDHVCTGNSAYRKAALEQAGLFDESFGYGYDNDMSYRLAAAGYRLAMCREARSVHRWRESAWDYLRQQYGVGFGRLDLVAKHRGRLAGDDEAGILMILHAPLMLLSLLLGASALVLGAAGGPWQASALAAVAIVGVLAVERGAAGVLAWRRFADPAGWWFAPVHLLRDCAWAVALVRWAARRLLGQPRRPSHSM